jgi:hypothetical protein
MSPPHSAERAHDRSDGGDDSRGAHPDCLDRIGLNAGIIDRAQFTVLIGAVIGSAIIPTIVAQRWFAPPLHDLTAEEIAEVEDEEFEPGRRQVVR